MTDIISEIDALIDEQLTTGEPRTGYDFGDPQYPKCWHCGKNWHGLKITAHMECMRYIGHYDESYSYADDDSEVLCPGSDFIGPIPMPMPGGSDCESSSWSSRWLSVCTSAPDWLRDLVTTTEQLVGEPVGLLGGRPGLGFSAAGGFSDGPGWRDLQLRWWRTTLPDDAMIGSSYGGITRMIRVGDDTLSFNDGDFRCHEYSGNGMTVDVLAESAPHIGGTWEPITTSGVTQHPEGQ